METATQTRSGIVFGREQYDESAWSADIMLRHWQELGHAPDLPLAPDFAMYAMMSEANKLRIYTARVDEQLIGYAVFLIGNDVLVKERVNAVCNLLYLEDSYRRGFTGYNLMKFANEALIDEGVVAISHCVSNRNQNLSILLERMGFRKQEEIWVLPVRGR